MTWEVKKIYMYESAFRIEEPRDRIGLLYLSRPGMLLSYVCISLLPGVSFYQPPS